MRYIVEVDCHPERTIDAETPADAVKQYAQLEQLWNGYSLCHPRVWPEGKPEEKTSISVCFNGLARAAFGVMGHDESKVVMMRGK